MKRIPRVYLDTSVVSALFDERNPERQKLTEEFFAASDKYEVSVSSITILEVQNTPDASLRRKMAAFIEPFQILEIDTEVEALVNEYIRYQAVPEDYREDAYHIAVASVNRIEYVVSWNFRHIVRKKTKDIVKIVNSMRGLAQTDIVSPGELL